MRLDACIRLLICALKWSAVVWEDLFNSDFPLGTAERGEAAQGKQCGGIPSAVFTNVHGVNSLSMNSTELPPCSTVEPEPSDDCVMRDRVSRAVRYLNGSTGEVTGLPSEGDLFNGT